MAHGNAQPGPMSNTGFSLSELVHMRPAPPAQLRGIQEERQPQGSGSRERHYLWEPRSGDVDLRGPWSLGGADDHDQDLHPPTTALVTNTSRYVAPWPVPVAPYPVPEYSCPPLGQLGQLAVMARPALLDLLVASRTLQPDKV